MYYSENNWSAWKYDNGDLFSRSVSPEETLMPVYKKMNRPILTLKEEALLAAKSTKDHFPDEKLNLFLSGGLDSELMLKSFLEIGEKPNIFIVRYEDDINLYDVSYAVTICGMLNLEYKIIDINLKKFFENDAEQVADDAQCDRPRMLPSMTYADYVDGLSFLSMGDMYWARPHNDYSIKAEWVAIELESDFAADRYNIYHNRPCVHLWARWTPGMMMAHTKWKWFHRLINDKIPGKLGNSSSKLQGWQEEFPNVIPREKVHGFENIDPLIDEFEKSLEKKYNGLPFRRQHEMTLDELYIMVTGSDYAANIS